MRPGTPGREKFEMCQEVAVKIHAEISNELIGEIAKEVVRRVSELLDARAAESDGL